LKIGIIGAGNIGSTLGRKWAAAGHEVRFGVRDPGDAKYASLDAVGEVSDIGRATAGSEVVLLALPGAAAADFASEHGEALKGKVVIDATNYVQGAEMNVMGWLAKVAPSARLVRAFSTLGWEIFADPQIGGEQIDLFFCSDPAARSTAEQLIAEVGLRPVYIGSADTAAALDGMTRLWFTLVFGQSYGRRTAFKLLSEQEGQL
jgi:8-hydroxy-5-deazaflavin:NADPH oxidoreductase